MPSSFPRPTPFMISEAVQSGLKIPAIEIDPRFNFVQGAFLFASDIDKMEMRFKSWKVPLAEARDTVIIPSIIQNFAEEGRPKWKPLKPQTIKNRMYMGFPRGPILERTGRLRKAATRKNIWELTDAVGSGAYDMLSLRTTFLDGLVPYAEFHQLGSGVRRGRMINSIRGLFGPTGAAGMPRGIRNAKGVTSGGFAIFSDEANPGLGQENRTFRMPPRPFIQLTLDEEIEIYGIFFSFMSLQVEKFWGPETRGLGL